MFAVIKTGGKQYRVAKDDVVVVERLQAEAGETVELDQVLMVGDEGSSSAGAPLVEGALVTAEVVEQTRGPKIIVFKKKRRKNHRRKAGHRQDLTVLRITEILTGGAKPTRAKAQPKQAPAEAGGAPADEAETAAPQKAAPEKAPAAKTAGKGATGQKTAAKKTAAKKTAAKKPAAGAPARKRGAAKATDGKKES